MIETILRGLVGRSLRIAQREMWLPLWELLGGVVGRLDGGVLQQLSAELLDPLQVPAALAEENDVSLVLTENVTTIHVQIERPVLTHVDRVLDELHDLFGVLVAVGITEEQQGEMRNLLARDLPNSILL